VIDGNIGCAGHIATLLPERAGHQNLSGFGWVLAQFAGGVDLGAKHAAVANAQDPAVTQADAQQHLR
jgi:hypothetical protein